MIDTRSGQRHRAEGECRCPIGCRQPAEASSNVRRVHIGHKLATERAECDLRH
jgi:hypothetical protein